jgi:glutamate synthase (NADPH/NADH) large chain
MGFRSLDEAIGRSDLLDTAPAIEHWKASGLDLSPILYSPDVPGARHRVHDQDHGLDRAMDQELIGLCAPALQSGEPVRARLAIRNVNRTVGTMLGSEVTRRHGGAGLPDGTIDLTFVGSAGQSFGAFLPAGITLRLEGDANDYVAKGLSGGRVIVRPDRAAPFSAEENIIAGNVIGYGATSGEVFLRGVVGERFCVRNSGAVAVAEGVGDHGCEYMTGGTVLILGPTGRNFGAGMSGGVAYLYKADPRRVNMAMVDLDPLDDEDIARVRALVTRHQEETDSAVATRILADFDPTAFAKVMPRDYKRVLTLRAEALARGEDPVMAVMGGIHG